MKFQLSLKKDFFLRYIFSSFTILIVVLLTMLISAVFYIFLTVPISKIESLGNLNTDIVNDYKSISSETLNKLNGFIIVTDNNGSITYKNGDYSLFSNNLSLIDYMNLFGVSPDNETTTNSNFVGYMLIDGFATSTLCDANDREYFLFSRFLESNSSLLILGIPSDYIKNTNVPFSKNTALILLIIINIIIALTIIILFSYFTGRSYLKPINKLISGVKDMENGNYTVRIKANRKKELNLLVTSFNKMAETIEDQQIENKNLEDLKNKLILDISHDLKNPLSSIMGFSNLILSDSNISKNDLEDYLKIINNNSIRCNKLITDLFEISLLETPSYNLSFKDVDICEILREIIASFIDELERKNFNYIIIIPEEKYILPIDIIRFQRGINNIIENSLKYNCENTDFTLKVSVDKSYLYILISDTGIGIPSEFRKSIFTPFIRANTSTLNETSGTGLGLSITKLIIEKHNGSIELLEMKGTNFLIRLPK